MLAPSTGALLEAFKILPEIFFDCAKALNVTANNRGISNPFRNGLILIKQSFSS
jgi:hypothetical protein